MIKLTEAYMGQYEWAAYNSLDNSIYSLFRRDLDCTWLPARQQEVAFTTREALLSEAGFEKVFRTQNWVRRSKQFCR